MDILLFDDDFAVMETMVAILKAVGNDIYAFHDADDILEFFSKTPHAFQVIVSDFSILENSDYKPLTMALHENPDAGVIIVSGTYANPQRLQELGFRIDGFLAKPFIAQKLVEMVDRIGIELEIRKDES